ncbi:MAG: T9SS type A sorting domain-containing protein, partial [Bacteroidota bacterium]
QFTMDFDATALEFVDVEAGALSNLTEANFGLTNVAEGVITTSWNATELAANDDVLFSITFRAKSDVQLSEAVSVNSRYTAAEAYDAGLNTLDVAIEFGNTVVAEGFELYQNAPNPFQSVTRIGFNLPEAGTATMTIMDISGKVLKVIDGEYAKGYNEVTLNRSELSAAGVLYYQLNTANDSATRKMIIVE